MPCAKEIVSLMIGEDLISKLGIIPLSNNTVHRRICHMTSLRKLLLLSRSHLACGYCIMRAIDGLGDLSKIAISPTSLYYANHWKRQLKERTFSPKSMPFTIRKALTLIN